MTLIAKLLVISRVFFLPDGDDISIPSEEDAFGDDFRSDPDEGIIGRFKPQNFDFSDDWERTALIPQDLTLAHTHMHANTRFAPNYNYN